MYGATKFGGLGLKYLAGHHCYIKLMFFVCHIRFNDETGRMLANTLARTQMELGVPTLFFQLPHAECVHLVTNTWLTHLREFLGATNITFGCSDHSK